MANLYLLEQADKLSNLRLTKEQIIDAIQKFTSELEASYVYSDVEYTRGLEHGKQSATLGIIRRLLYIDQKEYEK